MRLSLIALIGLVLASAPAPAAAQRVPDWRQSHLLENEPPVRILYRVATCLVLAQPERTRALLDSPPGSALEAEIIAALMPNGDEGCLRPTRRLRRYSRSLIRVVPLMRGAVAEAFIRLGRGAGAGIPDPPAAAAPGGEATAPLALGREVAHCAAIRRPDAVRALIEYNPGSPGEHRQLRRLSDDFERCLPDGRELHVDRLTIRSLLAEALYRLLDPAATPATMP